MKTKKNLISIPQEQLATDVTRRATKIKEQTADEVYLLLGFLGAGKTTLLRALANYLTEKGEEFTVIVNDV